MSTNTKYGRKEIIYLTAHSTHFIYSYMSSAIMVKNHLGIERANSLPPYHGLFFLIRKFSNSLIDTGEVILVRKMGVCVRDQF